MVFEAGAERICCILFTCNFTVRNNIMDEELKITMCRKYPQGVFVNIEEQQRKREERQNEKNWVR